MLGRAKQVKVDKENTIIVEGAGASEEIAQRIKQIKALAAETTSEYDKEKYQERLEKLAGGVAVINVGAATEIEMKEKKLRIEGRSQRNARRCGRRHCRGRRSCSFERGQRRQGACRSTLEGDEKTGALIIAQAIQSPMKQIASNAGVDGSVIVYNVVNSNKANYGYDALNDRYGDMIKFGIIDPAKVSRSALQNAASVASTLLTTESAVADIPEPAPAPRTSDGRRHVLIKTKTETKFRLRFFISKFNFPQFPRRQRRCFPYEKCLRKPFFVFKLAL